MQALLNRAWSLLQTCWRWLSANLYSCGSCQSPCPPLSLHFSGQHGIMPSSIIQTTLSPDKWSQEGPHIGNHLPSLSSWKHNTGSAYEHSSIAQEYITRWQVMRVSSQKTVNQSSTLREDNNSVDVPNNDSKLLEEGETGG